LPTQLLSALGSQRTFQCVGESVVAGIEADIGAGVGSGLAES
jgi:hypothetical protein